MNTEANEFVGGSLARVGCFVRWQFFVVVVVVSIFQSIVGRCLSCLSSFWWIPFFISWSHHQTTTLFLVLVC